MAKEDAVRKVLTEELAALLATNTRLTSHLRNEDRTLPKDSEDLAQFLENDEVLTALESRTRDRIALVRQAIARIDDGSYRTCQSCGGEIEADRLELLSTTPICAPCARESA